MCTCLALDGTHKKSQNLHKAHTKRTSFTKEHQYKIFKIVTFALHNNTFTTLYIYIHTRWGFFKQGFLITFPINQEQKQLSSQEHFYYKMPRKMTQQTSSSSHKHCIKDQVQLFTKKILANAKIGTDAHSHKILTFGKYFCERGWFFLIFHRNST